MSERLNAARRSTKSAGTPLAGMLADIQALSDIGIRFIGSAEDTQAARHLARRCKSIGLVTETAPFPVLSWSLLEEASLVIAPPRGSPWKVVSYPYVYSASTPRGGARGRVVAAGRQELFGTKFRAFERPKFRYRKYSIVDQNGAVAAQIVSRDFPVGARAAAWGVLPLPRTTPTVMIGDEDGRSLEDMVAGGDPVEAALGFRTAFHPDAVANNVIALLPGADRRKAVEHILVMAHFDTQYTGPGAVDNASGVAAVLALAEYFTRERPDRSVLFALYSGEEVGFVGAKHHLATLKERGQLGSIRAVLNLDMLACNEPNWPHASADFLAQESVRRAAISAGVAEKYGDLEIVTPCWPSGDQDPFDDEGIPCVQFTWKGYKYPHTHTPDDTPDKIDAAVLACSFEFARHVVINMDRML